MDGIINYLLAEYERLFPAQASYTPLVKKAMYTRAQRFEAIFSFYDTHGPDGSLDEHGNVKPRPQRIRDMCERAFRDALASEFEKISETSSFMLRNYARMNRQKMEELIQNFIQSDVISALTDRYSFITPVLVEASSPEWLSNRLGL